MPVCAGHVEQALQTRDKLGQHSNASADWTHRVSNDKGQNTEGEGHAEVQGWVGREVGVGRIKIHCLHV